MSDIQQTALYTSLWRHLDQSVSKFPICMDAPAADILNAFLTPEVRLRLEASPNLTAFVDLLAIRTRFIDDLVTSSFPEQLVIVGAGMDTRAHRLACGPSTRIFEVDTSLRVLEEKRRCLAEAGHALTCGQVHHVEGDVRDAAQLERALVASGFQRGLRTTWIFEGILEYVPRETHPALFAMAASMSLGCGRGGSLLIAQVLEPEFVTEGFLTDEDRASLPYESLYSASEAEALVRSAGWDETYVWRGEDLFTIYPNANGRTLPRGFTLLTAKDAD